MSGWHHAVDGARTRKALTEVVNDYLASWTPHELGRLPEHCRPGRVHGVEDITYWAETLADAFCSGAALGESSPVFSRILDFLNRAAERARALDQENPIQTGGHGFHEAPPDAQPQGD